jgi:hypothetical protein
MWTTENRPRHNRDKLRYPSDLTDDEWQTRLRQAARGRARGYERDHVCLGTGCQRREIAKDRRREARFLIISTSGAWAARWIAPITPSTWSAASTASGNPVPQPPRLRGTLNVSMLIEPRASDVACRRATNAEASGELGLGHAQAFADRSNPSGNRRSGVRNQRAQPIQSLVKATSGQGGGGDFGYGDLLAAAGALHMGQRSR